MANRWKTLVATALLCAGFMTAGCQSDKPTTASATATTQPTQTIQCDKCKSDYTVQPVYGNRGKIVGYTTYAACEDCKKIMDTYADTGVLEPTCKSCGGHLDVVKAK